MSEQGYWLCSTCGHVTVHDDLQYEGESLPPKTKLILPPVGGWKERTYYAVVVAWFVGNPLHRAIFYTGFLNGRGVRGDKTLPEKWPGGYNEIWSPMYDTQRCISTVHFLRVIAEIPQCSDTRREG
jgi:hypothetical protein